MNSFLFVHRELPLNHHLQLVLTQLLIPLVQVALHPMFEVERAEQFGPAIQKLHFLLLNPYEALADPRLLLELAEFRRIVATQLHLYLIKMLTKLDQFLDKELFLAQSQLAD